MRAEWRDFERRQQESESWLGRLIAIGIVLVIVVAGAKQFFGQEQTVAAVAPEVQQAIEEPHTVEERPTVEPPVRLYQGPPPARSGRESYVGVYECTVNGQRVVSDRPCGAQTQQRTLVIDQPDPNGVARQRQRQWQAQQSSAAYAGSTQSGGRSSSASTGSSNAAACASVDRAIESLNARMRQRYSSSEGERLRAQWHALKQQRYDLKCGR